MALNLNKWSQIELCQLIGFNHDVAILNNFSTIYILKQNYLKSDIIGLNKEKFLYFYEPHFK